MTELEKKSKNKKIISSMATWIVAIAVSIALSVAAFMLFGSKETHISASTTETTIKSLVCNSANPKNPFFISETAETNNHELKVTYRGETADKISYNYDGSYASNSVADTAGSSLHADYNIYMGENAESLYPTFSVVENKLKISLYTEYRKLNTKNAILFFINADEYQGLGDYSVDDLKNLYEGQGFSCEMSE